MNEQTPPTPDEPTEQMPAPATTAASNPTPRGTLVAGGVVIAVVCGLVGYQLGDNSSSATDQRVAGPGRGWGNQSQMMPPGQGRGQGFQGQDFQGHDDEGQDDQGQDDQNQDGQRQSGPPMSGAS